MELVTLTTKEVRRLEVLQALAAGALRQAEAARMLALSVRQVKRLVCRYRFGGAAGLASARRGRTPNNALDPALKARVLELYRSHYGDFGPTFAAEKLRERDGIDISRETLRRWLISEELWRPAKRRARPRPPRARRQCFGELVQIDGSPHNWFEDRGPRCTLLLAIDDATGKVGAALFPKRKRRTITFCFSSSTSTPLAYRRRFTATATAFFASTPRCRKNAKHKWLAQYGSSTSNSSAQIHRRPRAASNAPIALFRTDW
jgi:transposase